MRGNFWWGLFTQNKIIVPLRSNKREHPSECIKDLKETDCDLLDQMYWFIVRFVELPENIREYEPRALLEKQIEKVLNECYERR